MLNGCSEQYLMARNARPRSINYNRNILQRVALACLKTREPILRNQGWVRRYGDRNRLIERLNRIGLPLNCRVPLRISADRQLNCHVLNSRDGPPNFQNPMRCRLRNWRQRQRLT
jgi:hypothetical protein